MNREVSTLKLAQTHDNIVKFLAFEKKYLIMEFCTESMDMLLDKKENGLQSDELMDFTSQFFDGIKHLRKQHIIHRDLKPGNILVSRVNDKNVFKIADFGAARVLHDNEKYSSLYGTAEYLHPDIFAKFYAPLLQISPPTNSFTSKHEIWSIGATLFEAATGELPFEPILGRKNLNLQYQMMMGKKEEHIYAKEKENGQIEWYSHILEGYEIDKRVKEALEPFLAGMLKVSIFNKLNTLCVIFFVFQFVFFKSFQTKCLSINFLLKPINFKTWKITRSAVLRAEFVKYESRKQKAAF